MEICPITKAACGPDCLFIIKLTDYEGCPFDIADKAIQDLKINTILPLAKELDQRVRKYLQGKK